MATAKLIRILVLIPILLTVSVSAGDLDDLRWRVLTRCHINTSGNDQITAAEVDTLINIKLKAIRSDFPGAYTKVDTITLTPGTTQYTTNTDILDIDPPILWALRIKSHRDTADVIMNPLPQAAFFAALSGKPPPMSASMRPDPLYITVIGPPGSQKYLIYPDPNKGESVHIGYYAQHPVLDDTATFRLGDEYREPLELAVCAEIKRKLGLLTEASQFEALYRLKVGQPNVQE